MLTTPATAAAEYDNNIQLRLSAKRRGRRTRGHKLIADRRSLAEQARARPKDMASHYNISMHRISFGIELQN